MFNVGAVTGYLKLNTAGWTTGMGRANASLQSLSRTFTRFGAVGLGSVVLLTREFGKFDKAIRHATSVSELSERQFAKMSEMALDASVKWNKAAAATAQAFYYLGSAGLTATEQMDAYNDTIMLSRATGAELSTTVEGLVDIVRAFGLEFANTGMIADQITKTVISSNQTFAILRKALSYASSTARQTNNTLAETTAMLGVMANAGIKGSMAGTVLRRAMTNLMSPTGAMSELIYELGMHIYDSTGRMKPFIQIIGELSDNLKGTTDGYKNMIFEVLFGRRAIAGQIQLFNYGSVALAKYANEIANAGGTTERIAEKQMKAFTEQLGRLFRQAQRLSIMLGETLAPAIGRVADKLMANADVMKTYIKNNAGAIASTLKWVTVISTLLVVGGPLLMIITSLAASMIALAGVIANPFVILIGALYVFWASWKQKTNEMKQTVDELKKWGTITVTYPKVSPAISIPSGLKMHLPTEVDAVKGGLLGTAMEVIRTTWSGVVTQIKADTAWLLEKLKDEFKGTHPEIAKLLKSLGAIPKTIKDMIATFTREPVFTQVLKDAEEFNQELRRMSNKWRERAAEDVEAIPKIEYKGRSAMYAEWAKALESLFRGAAEDVVTWQNQFSTSLKSIRTDWSNTFQDILNDTYNKAMTLGNIFTDLFNSIRRSLARILSDLTANTLLYLLTGQKGKGMQFGTATWGDVGSWLSGKDIIGHYGGTISPPVKTPAMEYIRSNFGMTNYTPPKKMAPGVVINVKNEGQPIKLRETGRTFNGKDWVINTVMEEYNTNPNFRGVFGG